MSLRSRLLLAFVAIVIFPLTLLGLGVRHEMTRQLTDEYEGRLSDVVSGIRRDLERESDGISDRLTSLSLALMSDNAFRRGVTDTVSEPDRRYVLDYAQTAMDLTGLSMLQILDGDGRVISSGRFRNEYGRMEAGVAMALTERGSPFALVSGRAPDREFLALARAGSFRIGHREFALIGGREIDEVFLTGLARNGASGTSLMFPDGVLSSQPPDGTGGSTFSPQDGDLAIREIPIPLIEAAGTAPVTTTTATLLIAQSRASLEALVRRADSWFLTTALVTTAVALLLGVWVSARISRRLASLAAKTAVLDLDRLDIEFDEGTDEVGMVSRLLADLSARLRASSARVREAERRATTGDLARQINHDIKNGLIPLRNVVRHLIQVGRDDPATLAAVLAERRQTVDSSIAYLETLATNYERLSSSPIRRPCDLNALIADVVRGMRGHDGVEVQTRLSEPLPSIPGDPIAFRRILENLTSNALDSLDTKPGRITISTDGVPEGEPPSVRVTVADTGRGMSADESARIFNDFYTTKPGGTGLGLSIVRRLVMDAHGTLRVESEPGVGTRMIVEIPVRT